MTKCINVRNLVCSYGKEDILKDISFEVENNDIFFLMGNNGSGKTTLLNCLLNNLLYRCGRIELFGEDIKKMSRELFARKVAYIPQNFNTFCEFTVKDYLVLGRNPYIRLGNPQNIDYEIVEKYAKQTGVDDILERPFNTLSGGQKQWVAITRAMVQETPVMIMDEPMSTLDFGKQGELLILLKELNKQGKTIILTTHNPNHCLCFVDARVCIINNGIIEAYDFPKNAFNDAVVKKIYGENVCISVEGTLNFNMQ